MELGKTARKTGRPLSFDRELALDQAMLTFWRHGYETTSIVDLTTAMGVTAPSLYAAFGDKKRLFLEAVDRYVGDPAILVTHIRDAATAYDAARLMLKGAVEGFTSADKPRGCLLASATASGSAGAAEVQHAVAEIRRTITGHLRDRIERDVSAGVLPAETRAAPLAGLVIAVIQGLSVLARDGLARAELLAVAEATLAAWPR